MRHRVFVNCSDGSMHFGEWSYNNEWSSATCPHPQAVTSVGVDTDFK